jgi:L-threonylcarbamoyladenylate synthase
MVFENEKFTEILNVLNAGGVILYPTDTIWGIGCDATNAAAVEKVYRLKDRPSGKGFVLLVDSVQMLRQYVSHVHPRLDTLLQYHTRPLTVIYEKGVHLAKNVTAPDGSVAIRLATDSFCKALIRLFGKPIIATSANISGQPFAKHFGEISSDVLERVDFVVKFRQEQRETGEPSVIVRLNAAEELEFIRE